MPSTFLWTENYSVGIGFLDNQHKTLMELANNFVLNCAGAAPDTIKPYFKRQIAVILDYLDFHFKMEGQLLSLLKFPGADAHKKEHARGLGEIHYWLDQLNSIKLQVALSFIRYLRERIFEHITKEDQVYGRYILSLKHREFQTPRSECVLAGRENGEYRLVW